MNNKKTFILIILTLISAILSAGCSSAFGGMNWAADVKSEDSAGYDEFYETKRNYETEPPKNSGIGDSYKSLSFANTSASAPVAERKIIRDAAITMEVENAEKSYENILASLTSFGGYEAKRDMRGGNRDEYYGYYNDPIVTATLKIPAANLDAFLSGLKEQGEIINSNISSADITDQYFDAKIKLETLEITLETYYRFLENAKDVDEQLSVTRYINDITAEINQLKGSLKLWDSLVDYSTVVLYLYRPYEAPVPEPEPREIKWDALSLDDMGWFISSGFLGVVNFIFTVFQWILITIAIISPIIIPIAALLFFLVRNHKKKMRQLQKQAQAQINENKGNE